MKETESSILGMLYIVDVRMVHRVTKEKTKQKLLVVGGEASDIERKIRWLYDASKYCEFGISGIEKVREKVHVVSTVITQEQSPQNPIIEREEGTVSIPQGSVARVATRRRLYAVGLATTIFAEDEKHALRKSGKALLAMGSEVKSHSGPVLSEDSTLVVEEVPLSDGIAKPRNVSSEKNRAHFVRG